jgi:hypothetical protein
LSSKIRVGVILESLEPPMWVRSIIESIRESEFASLELLVVAERGERLPRALAGRFREYWRSESRSLYAALDRRKTLRPDAFEKSNIDDLSRGVASMRLVLVPGEPANSVSEADVAALRSRDLDVILRLGDRDLDGAVAGAARFGVWSCQHGDERTAGSGAPGFWEVAKQHRVTNTGVRVTTGDGRRQVLCRSHLATDRTSVRRNRNNLCWKSAALLLRKLEELASTGPEAFARRVEQQNQSFAISDRRPYEAPTSTHTTKLLAEVTLRRAFYSVYDRLWRDQWVLLYSLEPVNSLALWRFKELVPPRDRIWADPHLYVRGGETYLFIEELLHATRKGHIAVMTLDEQGRWSEPVKVLETSYHLSNPFVFDYDGQLYMLPESAANRSVDIFRCERFPDRWAHVKTVMSGVRAVDATLLRHAGKWWLFVNIARSTGTSSHDELFLFSAESPLADRWEPHPGNPIVSDARCARPAGPIAVRDGALIRPAQDCSKRYGYAIRLMRIEQLNETAYEETEVGYIGPHWGRRYRGIHTLDQAGSVTVVDALRTRSRFE